MADGEILSHIDRLIAEEHELRSRAVGVGLNSADRERLGDLERQLDQCWDLLRQRRAHTEFGEDPAGARVRPESEVESYRQ
ncbi:DUF2630 family protein [Amycolatopsis sp. NPDC059021]|uniref:DUF2630 family protein n=1 Tax=Amycolatopsis sp. NPDC059021 TaxID=3346704 RepID=UPI00366B4253